MPQKITTSATAGEKVKMQGKSLRRMQVTVYAGKPWALKCHVQDWSEGGPLNFTVLQHLETIRGRQKQVLRQRASQINDGCTRL